MSTPPPLYPDSRPHAHASTGAQPPAKKPGRSGCATAAIVLLVVGVLGLVAIAILAAIALPEYQKYVMRTRIVQAAAATYETQSAIAQYQAANGACPDATAFAQITGGVPMALAGDGSAPSAAWEWAEPVEGRCGFALRFAGIGAEVDGNTLGFRQQQDGSWTCDEGTLGPPFRRLSCASGAIANGP